MKNILLKIVAALHNALVWIIVSSGDPTKTSATLKFALLGLVPYILQATALACGFHLPHACVSLDQNALLAIVEAISNVAFWGLSIVSALGTVWALVRKVVITAAGENTGYLAAKTSV